MGKLDGKVAIVTGASRGMTSAQLLVLDGAFVRLAGHEVRLTPQDEAAWASIAPLTRARM